MVGNSAAVASPAASACPASYAAASAGWGSVSTCAPLSVDSPPALRPSVVMDWLPGCSAAAAAAVSWVGWQQYVIMSAPWLQQPCGMQFIMLLLCFGRRSRNRGAAVGSTSMVTESHCKVRPSTDPADQNTVWHIETTRTGCGQQRASSVLLLLH